jgi:hypothetical protein
LNPKVPNRPTVSVVGWSVPHGPLPACGLPDPELELEPHPESSKAAAATAADDDTATRQPIDVRRIGPP